MDLRSSSVNPWNSGVSSTVPGGTFPSGSTCAARCPNALMESTSGAAPATFARRVESTAPGCDEVVAPDSRSANRKNCRHDSSTDDGSRRYDSYASAMYPSLKTLVIGSLDMFPNLTLKFNADSVFPYVDAIS